MAKKHANSLIRVERVERAILLVRGHKVLLDRDLAELYGVKAIALRQQVSRNKSRFPADFMFRLSPEEAEALVSQNVVPPANSWPRPRSDPSSGPASTRARRNGAGASVGAAPVAPSNRGSAVRNPRSV